MSEKIPTLLKHKPVIISPDYAAVDGRCAGATDVQGLSVGLAQWNDRGKVDASAKVWRHTGGKWSRQSEELPIHRVLDLAIFTVRSLDYLREAYHLYDKGHPEIDRVGLQGGAMTVALCTDNENLDEDMKLLMAAIAKDDELLGERLSTLTRLLEDMGYGKRPQA
ncbi:MAG TPA: DUF6530 family protein [Terriglobales bacterium]|nr:DUF6530 family protein [Terriglobales bacterium]